MSTNQNNIKIPISLLILGFGIIGVEFEIFPALLKKFKSQEELNSFGDDMLRVIANRYAVPVSGSVLWTIYKNFCGKDIDVLVECANTQDKREYLMNWISDNFKE